jgi:hypothetical protein
MEYPPSPEYDPVTSKEIKIDCSHFFELMQVMQQRHRSTLHNTFDIDNSTDHLKASERSNGFLKVSLETKHLTHARCDFMEITSPEEVTKYTRYFPQSKFVFTPPDLNKSKNSEPVKVSKKLSSLPGSPKKSPPGESTTAAAISIQLSSRKCWVAVVDECLFVYHLFGGPLRYIVDLSYANIDFADIKKVPGMVLTANKSLDIKSATFPSICAVAVTRRECGDWKLSCFAARRFKRVSNIDDGIMDKCHDRVDFSVVFGDMRLAAIRKSSKEALIQGGSHRIQRSTSPSKSLPKLPSSPARSHSQER